MHSACSFKQVVPYDPKAAAAQFTTDCTNSDGTIVKTPTRGVLICRQSNGFEETCDFTNKIGTVCAGKEAAPTYDHSAEIGKQATNCLAQGGTLTSGPDNSITCKLPDGSGKICWYDPLSQYAVCSGFDGTAPNKTGTVGVRGTGKP
jgi:hypothetical protein